MRQVVRRQIHIRRRAMSSIPTASAFQWRQGSEDAVAQSVGAFNTFLRQAKNDVHSVVANISISTTTSDAAPKVVHVVIGNEAADADSIVSSLVYAHFKHYSKKLNAQDHTVVYVPVLSIPRDELVLRCDVSSLFSKLQLDLDALMFVDEFPWQHMAFGGPNKSATLRLTLLDHNALNTKRMVPVQQSKSEIGQVVEILDHHMDLGKHPTAPVREIAFANGQALVASNCTLVAEKIIGFSATHGRNDEAFALSSTLLLAVISLDSVNFDPNAKKVTARDIQAANELEKASFATKEALFEWLQAEKFNPAHWDAFSVRNCLQCDYKEFQLPDNASGRVYGVSAILIDLERFVKKKDTSTALIEQLQAFAQENSLAFLLVMTMYVDADGARRRQLLFYEPVSDKESLVPKCVQFLEQEGSLQLEKLELPASHADERLQAFSQRNAGASRKQVVPLLQQALEAPKTESKY